MRWTGKQVQAGAGRNRTAARAWQQALPVWHWQAWQAAGESALVRVCRAVLCVELLAVDVEVALQVDTHAGLVQRVCMVTKSVYISIAAQPGAPRAGPNSPVRST